LQDKKAQILKLVAEYIEEKREKETFTPGKDWVRYSGPTFDGDEYVASVSALLEEWLIHGKNTSEFEKKFPNYLGKKYGVFTNSGSSANLLMFSVAKKIYNWKDGDKIITPVSCFPATVNPIMQNNLKPVFVDVEMPSLNLNLDEVEELLENDTDIKGITFAHVLGVPTDMDRLMSLVDKYNLIFLEDTCDALGSYYKGKLLGSFGHISSCSFFPAHMMTTGEGGFVATNDYGTKMEIASYNSWGRACVCSIEKPGDVTEGTACGNRFQKWLPGMPEVLYDHRYVFKRIGYNLKPLDLQAAIGLQQLQKLPMMNEARRRNHKSMRRIFSKYKQYFELPEVKEDSDPCWFSYLATVKSDAGFTREDFTRFLEKNKIQTRTFFAGNILAHPGYQELAKEYGDLRERFPVSYDVTVGSFFLGVYVGITEEKMNYIETIVDKFFEESKI